MEVFIQYGNKMLNFTFMSIKYTFDSSFKEIDKHKFIDANNNDFDRLKEYFNNSGEMLIKYYIFSTREGKYKSDPFRSISRASARWHVNSVYRYWEVDEDPHFPHELVHIFAHQLDKPYIWKTKLDTYNEDTIEVDLPMVSTSFLQEGLAVALDDIIFQRKIHENGKWEFLDKLVENINEWDLITTKILNFEGFSEVPNSVSIPFAGYLSKHIIKKYSFEKFKQLYIGIKEIHSTEENTKTFNNILKRSLDSIVEEVKSQFISVRK